MHISPVEWFTRINSLTKWFPFRKSIRNVHFVCYSISVETYFVNKIFPEPRNPPETKAQQFSIQLFPDFQDKQKFAVIQEEGLRFTILSNYTVL